MRKLLLFCALIIPFIAGNANASECVASENDKVEYFAEEASKEVLKSYGDGQDMVVKITDCDWNSYKRAYKIEVMIYWNGSILRSKDYNVDGYLKFDENGKNVEFSQTWANENVKKLEFWTKVAGGAIILTDIAITEYNRN